MAHEIATDRRANLVGSIWMVASMAGFAIEDGLVKAASLAVPIGQILIIFGMGGSVVFGIFAKLNREALFTPDALSGPMRIRAGFEITGRLFYIFAIALTPLSSATVILQATPLVVVAGAALVFGETVGWRRWTAILIGLIGVVVIIRPGTDSFSALSILAVIGMFGFAGRDLASRAAPASLSTSALGFFGFLTITVAGLIVCIWKQEPFVWPDLPNTLFLTGVVLAGVTGYSCLMKAMRTGAVSAVTPFRYSRLLFGIGFGVFLFGEELSSSMVIGSGLIVISGLFILWRSNAPAR